VGKPYVVAGKTYVPREKPDGYEERGTASWYGADFHGRRTANGEIFSANAITGAHPTLPLPSYVRVTNTDNGRSVIVRVNDRGPYLHGRVMDLSHRAADILGYVNKGVGNVDVEYIGPAPLEGDDTRMLLASVNAPVRMEREATRLALVAPSPAPALRGTLDSGALAREIVGLIGYADGADTGERVVNGAHAAALAMASRDGALGTWAATVDEDARHLKLSLGTFADPAEADRVEMAFAALGAVDAGSATRNGRAVTSLTLSWLKPGVSRTDVAALARQLGLTDLALN
jgi:rare lipoprotein A